MQASILRELSILELVENRKRLQQAVFELEDLLATLEEERDESTATREMLQSSYAHLRGMLPGPLKRAWEFVVKPTTLPTEETRTDTASSPSPSATHPRKSLSLSFTDEKEEEECPPALNISVQIEPRKRSPSPAEPRVKGETFVIEEAVAVPLKIRKPEQPPVYPRTAKHKTLRASKSQNMPRQTPVSKRKSDLN